MRDLSDPVARTAAAVATLVNARDEMLTRDEASCFWPDPQWPNLAWPDGRLGLEVSRRIDRHHGLIDRAILTRIAE